MGYTDYTNQRNRMSRRDEPSKQVSAVAQNSTARASNGAAHFFAICIYIAVSVLFTIVAGNKLTGTGTSELKGLGFIQAAILYGPVFLFVCLPLWPGTFFSILGAEDRHGWVWMLAGFVMPILILWFMPLA
jgi:uncharacterized MAPEG superfamily protein